MPTQAVKSYAPKYAKAHRITRRKATSLLERAWVRAKSIAEKKGLKESEGDSFFAYVMGIWKKMVGFEPAEFKAEGASLTVDNAALNYAESVYQKYAKRYFFGDMPVLHEDILILFHPLQKTTAVLNSYFHAAIDANAMVQDHGPNAPLIIMLNPFFATHLTELRIVLLHEMVHAYIRWQYRKTGDKKWNQTGHGEVFMEVVDRLKQMGINYIQPTQAPFKLQNHYYCVAAKGINGGTVFIRLDSQSEFNTVGFNEEFAKFCDTSEPFYVAEVNDSFIIAIPYIDKGRLRGKVFPKEMDVRDFVRAYPHANAQNWQGD